MSHDFIGNKSKNIAKIIIPLQVTAQKNGIKFPLLPRLYISKVTSEPFFFPARVRKQLFQQQAKHRAWAHEPDHNY